MDEENTLRMGRVRGVTTTKWQRVWAERYGATLEVVDAPDEDAVRLLREGGLDMCFVRLPVDRTGLHAIPLYEETMVAWVSKDHAISAVEEITLADLEGEQVETEVTPGAADLLLAGVVLMVPMSVARQASRRDLTYRPITDATPSPVALTWRVEDENPLIEEFIGVVRGRTANSSRGASENSASGTTSTQKKAQRTSAQKRGSAPRRAASSKRGASGARSSSRAKKSQTKRPRRKR